MATTLNFRSALRGFNREDVIQYIEYSNSKHANQLSQLTSEAEELRQKLEQTVSTPDLTETVEKLTAQLEEAAARQAQLEAENQQLAAEIETLKAAQNTAATNSVNAMELEAYRRAEQVERNAKVRAEQIYQQAAGTIAQATTQVDDAAALFRKIADQVGEQMTLLQNAVDDSKNALMDAAATMYAIRPNAE